MSLEGIDCSKYQTTTPPLATRSFLFARATYSTWPDPMYATHIANARAAGLIVGSYHFGTAAYVPSQVAAFLGAAGSVDLYVLDLESNGGQPSMTQTQARAFIAAVQKTGRKIGLYHSESGFPSLGQDYDWVANWSQVPARHWTFWQYRGSPLDLDRFNGDIAALRALAGKAPPPKFEVRIEGNFGLYTVVNGIVTGSRVATSGGFTADCTAPRRYPWPGHTSQTLVKLLDGPVNVRGKYVRATWMVP